MTFGQLPTSPRKKLGQLTSTGNLKKPIPGDEFPVGTDANTPVLEGDDFCILGPTGTPTKRELIEAAYDIRDNNLLGIRDTGGGSSQSATVGDTTFPNGLPLVRRGALIIFQVPAGDTGITSDGTPIISEVACCGQQIIGGQIPCPDDHIYTRRFAAHKGMGENIGANLVVDQDLLHDMGLHMANSIRSAFVGNIKVVDQNGKIGMDTFSGPEFTYPNNSFIRCGTSLYGSNFCSRSSWGPVTTPCAQGECSTKNWAINRLIHDPIFDPYHYLIVANLGCWNSGNWSGGFRRLSLMSNDTNDKFKLFVFQDIDNTMIAGGVPGGWVGDRSDYHPNGRVSSADFDPHYQYTDYPESWDWPCNLWDLKQANASNYFYDVVLHELGHGSEIPMNSPNSNVISGGFRHEMRITDPDGSEPWVDTLPCVFADTGPNDVAGNCGALDPGNTAAGMNYHNVMSYSVLNDLNCAMANVPCDPALSPYGMEAGFNTSHLHFMDYIGNENVYDLTPIDQTAPGIIFEDWLYAGDLFWIHPELPSLGDRKVLIKQDMHCDGIPYPSQWDQVVPVPKRRFMSLVYYARGYIEKRTSAYQNDGVPIDSPDGVIYLNWGPQAHCWGGGGGCIGMMDAPTYARLDVNPSNPAPPLIINGFNIDTPWQGPESRFYGWKIETVDFTNEPVGGKTKVKIRITSLGDAGA